MKHNEKDTKKHRNNTQAHRLAVCFHLTNLIILLKISSHAEGRARQI